MASYKSTIFMILLALLFPAIAYSKDFIVGDQTGWTINFNYQTWANGKDFQVGDRLVFKYPSGVHNVFKVNGTDFKNCTKPLSAPPPLTSGNDVIVLATPGRKWYICGVANHCASGQKLFINVNTPATWMAPSLSPSPSQSMALPYTNSGIGFTVNVFYTLVVMAVAVSWAIFGF